MIKHFEIVGEHIESGLDVFVVERVGELLS
jgi:hypothetical protein